MCAHPADPLESILSGVPMPLVLIGPDERLQRLNRQAVEMFGANMEGRHFLSVLRQPAIIEAIADARSKGSARETRFSEKDAMHETIYRVICAPVAGDSGRGVLVSFSDVTSVETAGQVRRDFVANVSHELRTPLTAILGFIETLRGPARDDAAARDRFLETMNREAERMNRLVRDLLSLSRVETEERMQPAQVRDLRDLLQSVCRGLRPLADGAGIHLDIVLPESGCEVRCDPDQLMQVFTNLIDNAMKYGGGDRRVFVTLSRLDRDPVLRAAAFQVEVRDEGPGLESIHLHRLTERFYRADNHRSREVGGTGLGLAIVKHILNRHRGRLKIESTLGQGSRFYVILPCLGSQTPPGPEKRAPLS